MHFQTYHFTLQTILTICSNVTWTPIFYLILTLTGPSYGIAGRAASQSWLGMGGRGIGVRGVPGSNPGGGTTPFDGVSFK